MGKLNIGITIAFIAGSVAGCGSPTSEGPNELQIGGGGGGGSAAGGAGGVSGSGGSGTGGDAGAPSLDASAGPPKLDDAQVLAILQAANQGEIDQANAALTCARNPQVV